MPITVNTTSTPDLFAPVNTPLWFIFSGFTSGLQSFNYIIDVNARPEPFATSDIKTFGTYKIPPRPVTGEGWFTPNKIIKGSFNNFVNPFINGFGLVDDTYIQYNLNFGWEYNPNSAFTATYSGSGGNFGIVVTDNSDFQVGDTIKINKTNSTVNPQYNGVQTITALSGATGITLNTTYGINVTNESGLITYHSRQTGTTVNYRTYNGTRQYDERTLNFADLYLIDTSSTANTKSFLYTYPEERKKTFIDSYETLSLITNAANGYSVTVERFDINGNVIGTVGGTPTLVNAVAARRKWDFGVGPQNIIEQTGNANYFNGVDYYTVRVTTSGNANTVSQRVKFKIVPNCSIYDNYRLVFLNRVGGYEYFDFKMNHKKTTKIERTEYGKILDWNYSMGERGRDILNIKATETFEINSDWVTQAEAEWLEQVFTSPDVYVIRNNELHPIIVTDSSYQSKNTLREQIFNVVVNFKYAYPINLQNL